MEQSNFTLIKLEASEGKVIDWAEPRFHDEPLDISDVNAGTIQVQDHLYASVIFLAQGDNPDNYVEVDKPTKED